MSDEAISAALRAALLKELKEKRTRKAAIEASIARIEALLASETEGTAATPRQPKPKLPRELAGVGPGDAGVWMLRHKNVPMTNRDIVEALASMGYKKIKSPDHIGAALHHRAKKTKDVRRDGNHWVWVYEAFGDGQPATPQVNGPS